MDNILSMVIRFAWGGGLICTFRGWGCSACKMSRAKSARVFSEHDKAAKRARFGRSMSLAPVPVGEKVRSAMGDYIGERPLSAACKDQK